MQIENLRIAYASYDENLLKVANKYFSEQPNFSKIKTYSKSKNLINDLKRNIKYDVIVVDEYLQDIDILGFLECYASNLVSKSNLIIITCSQHYISYTNLFLSKGVDYCVVKPVKIKSLIHRIYNLYQAKYNNDGDIYKKLYKRWNVSSEITNCQYLTQAVMIASSKKEKLAIRKEILMNIATMNNVSVSAVDSSIRRLIKQAECASTPDYIQFKISKGIESTRPKTGQLIYAMKEWIEENKL